MEAIDLNAYIYEDEWNRVEDYIRTGGDVNIVTAEGKTLLHFAAERDRVDILRLLLRGGANPNLQDEDGKTPLHYALDEYYSRRNDKEDITKMIELLVANGADIEIKDNEGRSPESITEDDAFNPAWIRGLDGPPPPPPKRNIPSGSENSITYANLKDGNAMVNFHNEYTKGRYFKQSTYNNLPSNQASGKKISPFTRRLINGITRYTARIVAGGKRRKLKTMKRRKGLKRTRRS